jgi:two-component system LytT family response regulator
VNGDRKLVSKTLKYFGDLLSENAFVRVHKSYLVNVNAIIEYRKGKGGSIVLFGKKNYGKPRSKNGVIGLF